jgi:betaine-aldehyde dehydrogenase
VTTIVDPVTGEAYTSVPVASPAEVGAAVQRARDALDSWSATTPADRQAALLALADAIADNAGRIARAEARNVGWDPAFVHEQIIPAAIDELRFMAGAARAALAPASGSYVSGFTSTVVREPVGVCALITPWNYPLQAAIDKLAPALATGNTVVLKPAETTPLSALILGALCDDILPPGVATVVTGDRHTGRALVTHPDVDLVSLTGSTQAGEEITATAGIKRLHLELGGNAPAIVLADADLVAAADGISQSGFGNAGQDCTAACRVLVASQVHDELVALLVERARSTSLTPLNNHEHLERVRCYLAGLPGNAKVLTGGHVLDGRGFFVAPTIVTDVRQDDVIVQDEVFGPVITVQAVTDDDEAVRLANDVAYGLSASVWSGDRARATRLSRRLHAGTVWINTHGVYATEMPHGGFKRSGFGKDLSVYALDAYTRIKHLMVAEG